MADSKLMKVAAAAAEKKGSVEREVVLAVLVHCCNSCTKTVKKAQDKVEGVNSVSMSIRDDMDTDLVTVKGTKELDVEKLIKYVKTKLGRKHVHLISDKLV